MPEALPLEDEGSRPNYAGPLSTWEKSALCGHRGAKRRADLLVISPVAAAPHSQLRTLVLMRRTGPPAPALLRVWRRHSATGFCRFQDEFASFEQRFEVGEDLRPAARNGLDKFRFRAIHHMSDSQLQTSAIRRRLIPAAINIARHCEERSDEATQIPFRDSWIASPSARKDGQPDRSRY
jgi:hypothetical protein